jgi:polysaccharide export outer membrane protein
VRRVLALALLLTPWSASAQVQPVQPPAAASHPQAASDAAIAVATAPADYVIGAEDVLQVLFWRDKDMSGEFIVRPDGKISVPLLNDVHAAGLTPEQLRAHIVEAARRYVEEPNATVVVKQINSRKVFITGSIEKPGTYPLTSRTTVLQLIATAGGLKEYAKRGEIRILRSDDGREVRLPFHYDRVISGKNLKQNVELKPGDTVVVP